MMSRKSEIITPVEYSEVVGAQTLDGIDYERRISLGKLVARTAAVLDLPAGYASDDDLLRARPDQLQTGLYVLPQDARYEDAELRIRDTIFPSQEFSVVARSPGDLVRHAKSVTRKARAGNPDRDETEHATNRSAAHALEAKLVGTDVLLQQWQERRRVLASLAIDLGGTWPHYKAKNLELRRVEVDQAIHQTAEVAAVNRPDWDNQVVQGIHRAIKVHLYRTDTSAEHRIARWLGYMKLVDRHTFAKFQVASTARKFTDWEFQKYKSYLEDVLF
ncbi:MAG: hypothetical protein QFB87_01005 [Patescibacteria group bacterium]|nr:hypothetical protein [Patescibacteria group bacterium]